MPRHHAFGCSRVRVNSSALMVPMLIGLVARKTNIQRGFLVAAASGAVFLTLIVIRGMMIG